MNRIHFISTPRNISTGIMYSFAQHPAITVVDEPLYAHYLRLTDVDHPGKTEILAQLENDGEKVIQNIFLGECDTSILFIKNMSKHLMDLDLSFMNKMKNVFLIRNPKQLIASFAKVVDEVTMDEIGLNRQYELFKMLQKNNQTPIVLDSGELLKNPEMVLSALCKKLEIDFDKEMLSWKAGARPEDGIWAKYWYANVHKSTGFKKQKTSDRPLPQHLYPIYEQCQPLYEEMKACM